MTVEVDADIHPRDAGPKETQTKAPSKQQAPTPGLTFQCKGKDGHADEG